MGEWKIVKLAEVLRYRKSNILINNDEEYSLCRVQLHRRGVVLREKKMGGQIKTKKQQVCRAGDLVVAEMDAKFGGYGFIPDHLEGAIVSSHYYLYELDKNKITQEYFEILIKTDFIQNQIEAKGSTNYSSIRAWEFLDYEIPLQSIALQNIIAAKYLKHSRFKDDLGIELNAQLKYLSQLRQQILQEAVEGKLTANWRAQHPDLISGDNHASKLLDKIKAEKERLIKEGKIKKDKPLAPITDAEKPFDLPEGWAWCRLGDIIKVFLGGYAYSSMLFKKDGQIQVLRLGNIRPNLLRLNEKPVFITNDYAKETSEFELQQGDILITMTGTRSKRDYCYTMLITGQDLASKRLFLNQRVGCIRLMPHVSKFYFNHALKHNRLLDMIFESATGSANQANIGSTILKDLLIPFPSLAEQQAIVERIDKLMAMIDELEKQVSERKEQSEILMQSVLRETFAKE